MASSERGPRLIGQMTDIDGVEIAMSLNRDGTMRVQIGSFPPSLKRDLAADLDREKIEEFGRLFITACWEAGHGV